MQEPELILAPLTEGAAADLICARLLDSEEHAVEAAVPPVAEDAVQVIHAFVAELAAARSACRGHEAARTIVDNLLDYAVRFAEVNEEPATGDCWSSIDAARAYLRETATKDPGSGNALRSLVADAGYRVRALAALRAGGLTIGDCIQALAVGDDDPYVRAARTAIMGDDEVEIDDRTTTSVGDGGAWVLAWLWTRDAQAGVRSNSELLDAVLASARYALAGKHGLDTDALELRQHEADLLDDVIDLFPEEIDGIATARTESASNTVQWDDDEGRALVFVPSEAVKRLLELGRRGGLPPETAQQCERFLDQHGKTLDALLNAIQGPVAAA